VKDFENTRKNKEELKGKNQAKLEQISVLKKQFEQVEDECPLCNSPITIEKKDQIISDRKKSEKDIKASINQIQTDLINLNIIIKTSQDEIAKYQQVRPTHQNLIKWNKNYVTIDKKLTELNKELATLKEEYPFLPKSLNFKNYDKIKNNINLSIRKLEMFRNKYENKGDYEKTQKKLKSESGEIKKTIKTIEKSFDKDKVIQLNAILTKIGISIKKCLEFQGDSKLILSKHSDLKKQHVSFQIIKKEIKQTTENYDEKLHNKKKLLYDSKLGEKGNIEGRVKSLKEERIPELKANLKDAVRSQKELEKLNKNIGKIEKKNQIAITLREIIVNYLPALRKTYTTQISNQATSIFRQFYPKSGFERIILDENYNIDVKRLGKIYNSKRLSGGEKKVCGLAIRIAMARNLSKQGLFLLDEPTDALDDKHREDLIEFLKQKIPIEQVLIISHYDKIMECADSIIRVYNEGNYSKIRSVS
jgi:exonuclease SbcC